MNAIKMFLGFNDTRTPEGSYSWQHLTFVTALMLIMIALAVFFGLKYKRTDEKQKTKVLMIAAILIDCFEIFKLVVMYLRSPEPMWWSTELPLFLCSIQLITIPLAAFTKGKIKEAALDFVFIFGILGAVLGTYGAAQNYACYPVLSMDNVVSGITHSISGFSSLYIAISGLASMKKKNIFITFSILFAFCAAALIANRALDYNYMFLRRGDGTPYDIVYNLVNGNKIIYPAMVILLFMLYIAAFYLVFFRIKKKKAAKENSNVADEVIEEAEKAEV